MKFVKLACVALVGFTALACTPTYKDKSTSFSVMPEELKDCKIFYVLSSDGAGIYITKCPHADTTTSTTGKGKTYSSLTYGD